jgi:type I restriction enzyme M protein
MIYHLSPKGVMACVLANGSLSSQTNNEGEIRKTLIENDLVDCIVALPKQLFYNTGIPACIWFISRKRAGNGDRKRTGEILFIDASEVGFMADSTHREFAPEDITKISNTYHEWRKHNGRYDDIKGFCKSANIEEITKHNFVLTPGRYVGIKDEEDDGIPFEEKIFGLTTKLAEQIKEEKKLDEEIKKQLKNVGFDLK